MGIPALMESYIAKCGTNLYREGRAPGGDILEQLKIILCEWLKLAENAGDCSISVNKARLGNICKEHGHYLLLTIRYLPELQPIEELWRGINSNVVREFGHEWTMPIMLQQIIAGFKH